MKCIKRFSRFEGDGFSEERKFERLPNRSIAFECKLETNLIPFAMDMEKKEFVIFMIKRQNNLSLFLWVSIIDPSNADMGEKIRLTVVNDLMRYIKWTTEPMDVSGKFPDEAINKALSVWEECSDSEIKEIIQKAAERLNEIGGYDKWIRDERELLKLAKQAKTEGDGLLYMY